MKDKEAFQARKDKQLSGKAQSLFTSSGGSEPLAPHDGGWPWPLSALGFPGALLRTGALKSRDPAPFHPPVPAHPWQLLPNATKEPFPIP